jgi:hypothetical protein
VLLDVQTNAVLLLYDFEQRLRLLGRSVAIKHESVTWQCEEIHGRGRLVDGKIGVAVACVTRRVGGPCR